MSKAPEKKPMDDTIHEKKTGTPATNTQRVCYAIRTLVDEVYDLFPETPVEYSAYDGRNTATDVTFDLSTLDSDDGEDLIALLQLIEDPRVDYVLAGHEDPAVLVSMKASLRTQDNRDPFGLSEAYSVLYGADETGAYNLDFDDDEGSR